MIRTSGDNAICISGRVQGDAMLDHELYGEAFYSLYLEVPRLSGAVKVRATESGTPCRSPHFCAFEPLFSRRQAAQEISLVLRREVVYNITY